MTTDATHGQPDWLVADPCPPWCLGDHPVDEHPDDRAHQSRVIDVPVIVADTSPGVDDAESVRAAGFIVGLRRYAGQADTWIYIGEGDNVMNGFDVTEESARRLMVALQSLLDTNKLRRASASHMTDSWYCSPWGLLKQRNGLGAWKCKLS